MYEILVDNGVSVPRYAVLEEDNIEQDLVEHEDYIEVRKKNKLKIKSS